MRRRTVEPRPGWQAAVEAQGLIYAVCEDPRDPGAEYAYWDESAYYEFSLPEVESLEEVVEELHGMCLEAADHVVRTGRFADYGITDPRLAEVIAASWRRREEQPSLYGRFDLAYDGTGPAKMFEYNADTPTSLIEAASPQWFWMEERFPEADQWNSLHERLVAAWARQKELLPPGPVHFAHSRGDSEGEDWMTTLYLQETAEQAGLETVSIAVEDIGLDGLTGRFVDLQHRYIRSAFKLYPWEWLAEDEFGEQLLATVDLGGSTGSTLWIEPPWKMLLSNKALLAVLWELFPGHPNLLPAYLDGPRELTATGYAAKPLLGREGSGVRIVEPGGDETLLPAWAGAPDRYGAEGFCFQQLCPLPVFDGNQPVLGAWVVDGEAAGLGIRETHDSPITHVGARFLPHVIV
ncbi:glutathionylspermidine synthase family protein [Streptomyces sp. NRRL B-24484]|uniref:glutathionylspermidine synthase family protein n=1 Tax=Streptomyces sp. NRRL B-24484 TaxID=1463833 RepID=UPI0004C1E601|nr:glutathionylspermidine synthase family protein [Streptomyces sp. NRRL B-24484]